MAQFQRQQNCSYKTTEFLIWGSLFQKKNWIVGPSPPKPKSHKSGTSENQCLKSKEPFPKPSHHRHPPTVRLYLALLHLLQELNRMFPFTFPICASTDGCVVGYHVGICPASDVIQKNQCQICQFRIQGEIGTSFLFPIAGMTLMLPLFSIWALQALGGSSSPPHLACPSTMPRHDPNNELMPERLKYYWNLSQNGFRTTFQTFRSANASKYHF